MLVALKKILVDENIEREGFPITAIREIQLLKALTHESVVCLQGVVSDHGKPTRTDTMQPKGAFFMVFEYMQHDLTGILEGRLIQLTDNNIRGLMRSLLEGLNFCHKRGVLHRDIKASNLLLNSRGQLKIADFGLARRRSKDKDRGYTNQVITLWYRPPELLLGMHLYGPEVDIWSAGCVFGELFNRRPIFQAKDELGQLECIARLCGTPNKDNWPSVGDCPHYEEIRLKKNYPRTLTQHFMNKFKGIPISAVNLLDAMLVIDPSKRTSAEVALDHPYLAKDQCEPFVIDLKQDCHEMWANEKKHARRERARKDAC